MTTRFTHLVPRDAADVTRFADDFRATYGVTPLGGGETMLGVPPQTAPPAAPDPGAAPPPAAPAAPDPAGQQPATPAAPAEPVPDWASTLLQRMDQIAPVEPDPVAVDLGLASAPPMQPTLPQQPQVPASPGLGQQPQQPQPGAPFPGTAPQSPEQQYALIQAWIREEAEKAAGSVVDPRFEQLRARERQQEVESLRQDYEEIRDPQKAAGVLSRARQWSGLSPNPDVSTELVREPWFLELVVLASRSIDAQRVAQAGQPPAPTTQVLPASPSYPIEQPGPAAPGAPIDPQLAIQQRIVDAGKGSGLSPLFA